MSLWQSEGKCDNN